MGLWGRIAARTVLRTCLAALLGVPALAVLAAFPGPHAQTVRDVTDSRMIRLEPQGDALTRVSPDLAARAAPAETVRLFHRVVIEDAGHFLHRGERVALPHVAAPGADAVCAKADGGSWTCGLFARNALRRLVRARAIACDVDAGALARCRVGRTDLAAWLVGQGWAEPAAEDTELTALRDASRAAGRGLHALR